MFKNYFVVALRSFLKNKTYTCINIAGFSLGLACTFLIALYVYKELTYDRYHQNTSRIYRLTEVIRPDGVGEASASVPLPVGPTLRQDFPDLIKGYVRFFNFSGASLSLESTAEKRYNEKKLFFTDADIFSVFGFPLLKGNPQTALSEPNSIVITGQMAEKYFGIQEPMGKILKFENKQDLKVTGVLAEIPSHSHIHADFMVSFSTLNTLLADRLRTNWFWNPAWTYLLLADDSPATYDALNRQLEPFMQKYFSEVKTRNKKLVLQPLKDIHLHSRFSNEIEPTGDSIYVYVFSLIGLFILTIACINFVNLSTARSITRAKEVGVRKVLGSGRQQLIIQFLSEAFLLSIAALLIAYGLTAVSLPLLNQFSGREIMISGKEILFILTAGFLITGIVGLLAGLYPAFYLSAFSPLKTLKGSASTQGARGSLLRKTLVVIQFSLSVLLIIGTIVTYFQLNHLQKAALGFNKEQVLIIPINRSGLTTISAYENFKKRLLQNKDILSITAMEDILGQSHNSGGYLPEGKSENMLFPRLIVREDFTQTFDIPILAGKSFTGEYKINPAVNEVLINESMIRFLGWESAEQAIGKRLGEFRSDTLNMVTRVVGVMKDFHTTSLHQEIKPFVLESPPQNDAVNKFIIKYMAIRISPSDIRSTIQFIENNWNNSVDDRAFEYSFLDENLQALYEAELRFRNIALVFTLLAIFIACMGLFGLAVFTAGQRKKEIGIRKVLGASVGQLTLHLSKDFLKLVLLSNLIASPLAYYLMHKWLENFVARITMEWWMFAIAGGGALCIALITISYQSLKAAMANPVKSLRSE